MKGRGRGREGEEGWERGEGGCRRGKGRGKKIPFKVRVCISEVRSYLV